MKKQLLNTTIVGIIIVSILGTLLHFFYEWSGSRFFVGLFSPVSESTWEHIKLLFFPMLLYGFYMQRRFSADFPCITSALSSGILIGSLMIPVLFYTYTGIIGFHIAVIDIAIFFVSVVFAFVLVYRFTQNCRTKSYQKLLSFGVLLLLLLFFLFSYAPPSLPLFQAP